MSEHVTYGIPNLLAGTRDWSGSWQNINNWKAAGTINGFSAISHDSSYGGVYKAVKVEKGVPYAFSAMVKAPTGKSFFIFTTKEDTDGVLSGDEVTNNNKVFKGNGAWQEVRITFTPHASKCCACRIESDSDEYTIETYGYMLVYEIDVPAAWAPAEGETLTGGGASTSANLLAGYSPRLAPGTAPYTGSQSAPETDLWSVPASSDYRNALRHDLDSDGSMPALGSLSSDQTVTISAGVTAATSASISASLLFVALVYTNSEGSANVIRFTLDSGTIENGKWTRIGGTAVVPSGMTITRCGILAHAGPALIVTDTTLSYGSGIPVAEETFTPFESAGHAQTTYATYASQKILSDSITAEVNARSKTDGAVSELSSKLSQTVEGINVSLDRLAATDKQIHSWFDFGSDASGNPKLSMGSSSSPIVGEYSNTGTAYKSRSGATLLALDAASSTTTADHMLAKDIAIGKWQWVPTNCGNNLTLVWKG